MSSAKAQALIDADTHRYVGGDNTNVKHCGILTMITECITNDRVWKNVPCGGKLGYKVRQLVKP